MANQGEICLRWGSTDNLFRTDERYSKEWHLHPSISFYELGAQGQYYCYTSEELTRHGMFSTVKEKIQGQYLWIELQTTSSPFFFGMLIDTFWIQEQLQLPAFSPFLQNVVAQVLERWQNHNTGLLSRHFVYQKNYQERSYRKLITVAYFYELLNRFVVEVEMEIQTNTSSTFRNADLNRIREVVENVLQTIHLSIPSIEQMATASGMSASKFKILFKEIYGVGPHQYILDKKLAYAHALFKSGQYTLTQIAYKIGYNHTSGFTRIYKKYYENRS
jgi:AraC family transcriptional regulator, exoenzyme S synthesis regulatory protein ExsA